MDTATLKIQHDKLLKANYLWDERYSQLQREFDEYQKGATEAQLLASGYIYVLKDKVDVLQKELNELKSQQSGYRSGCEERALAAEQQMLLMRERLEQELRDVQHEARSTRMELDSLQIRCRELHVENSELEELQRLRHRGGGGGGGGQRVWQLQEDNDHLRHQATIYRDDFLAERRDREKMVDQIAQLKIKLDTEASSLRLQMDTLRTVREKLYKDNTALMAQSSLKTAQKNQLMANYFRGQVSLKPSKTSSRSTQLINSRVPECPELPANPPEVTMRILVFYIRSMGRWWKFIAYALGVGEQATLLADSLEAADSKCLTVLQTWIDQGPDVTWKNLLDALWGLGLRSTAVAICEKLNQMAIEQ